MDFQHSHSAKARGNKKKKNRNSSVVAKPASLQQGSGDNGNGKRNGSEVCTESSQSSANNLSDEALQILDTNGHCDVTALDTGCLLQATFPKSPSEEDHLKSDVVIDEASLQSSDIVMSSHQDVLNGAGLCQTSDCSQILTDCSLDQVISTPSIQLHSPAGVVSSLSDAAFLDKSQLVTTSPCCTGSEKQPCSPIIEQSSIEQHFPTNNSLHPEQHQETLHFQAVNVLQQPNDKEALPASLLKSYRDLQRQMTSLTRLQSLCASRTSCAKVSIHAAFDKLHNALSCRELELVANVDDIFLKTKDTLDERIRMAQILKALVDRSHNMSSEEHEYLRTHIKRYVSERGVDQGVGSEDRFTIDTKDAIQRICSFGLINPIAADYTYIFADFPPDSDNWAQLLSCNDKNNNHVVRCKEVLPSKIEELQDRLEAVRHMSCSSRIDHSLVACSTSTPASEGNKVEEVARCAGRELVTDENHVKVNGLNDNFAVTPASGLEAYVCGMSSTTSIYGVDAFEESSFGSIGSVFSRNCSVDGVVSDSTNGNGIYERAMQDELSVKHGNVDVVLCEGRHQIEEYYKLINEDSMMDRTLPSADEPSCLPSRTQSLSIDDEMRDSFDLSSVEVRHTGGTFIGTQPVSVPAQSDFKHTRGIIHIAAIEANLSSSSNCQDNYHSRGIRDGHNTVNFGRRHSASSSYGNNNHHDAPHQHYRHGGDRAAYGYKTRGNGKFAPGRTAGQSLRRSASYSTDNSKVDADGFTFVTHGGGHRQNGGRARGSSGDLTAKYFYGNDSSHGSRGGHKVSGGFYPGGPGSYA